MAQEALLLSPGRGNGERRNCQEKVKGSEGRFGVDPRVWLIHRILNLERPYKLLNVEQGEIN